MRWMHHRAPDFSRYYSLGKRFSSSASFPHPNSGPRTVAFQDTKPKFSPNQFLQEIQEGALEDIYHNPHTKKFSLTFLRSASALDLYQRLKNGMMKMHFPSDFRLLEASPLTARLVAGVGHENMSRILRLRVPHASFGRYMSTDERYVNSVVQKFGTWRKIDRVVHKDASDLHIHYNNIRSALQAKTAGFRASKDLPLDIEYSPSGDPCDNSPSRPSLFDRVLVKNVPEEMTLRGVVSLLQPDLGRFRSIDKEKEGPGYAISFCTHAAASRFLDTAIEKYPHERGLEGIQVMAYGFSLPWSRHLLAAVELGATRTVVLNGVTDNRVFSIDSVTKDFEAFGTPYLVSWNPERIHITFSDVAHACKAISRLRFVTKTRPSFAKYAGHNLTISFAPDPDTPSMPMADLQPFHLGQIRTADS
ncbi:hypothetical protein V5O48_007601 [Marasmius crinis-equi]|uniref:Uncharacterized protein n=1 Tax=Marasmius crinis-equi TaxID=585013 RepID=A0ABR3FG98_9AGAR